jgi:riboflavin transporter FmnP
LHVHSTRWQELSVLGIFHIEDDFTNFLVKTMLIFFTKGPHKTYAEISREFLATFKFVHIKEKVGKRGKATPTLLMSNLL